MSAKTEKLSGLEALAAGVDGVVISEEQAPLPGVEKIEAAQEVENTDAAMMAATIGVNFLADSTEQIWDCLHYGPETRQTGAEKIAPLLQKYGISGGVLGEWLSKWQAEIAAGMFFGGVIVASVRMVKEHNAKQAEEKPEAGNVTALRPLDDISGD